MIKPTDKQLAAFFTWLNLRDMEPYPDQVGMSNDKHAKVCGYMTKIIHPMEERLLKIMKHEPHEIDEYVYEKGFLE